jgi:hypothetical protein
MRHRIHFMREQQVVSDDADILPTRIRQSVQAGRVVAHHMPAILETVNPGLSEDYLNLARYIHNTPLYRGAPPQTEPEAGNSAAPKSRANEPKRKGR